MCRLQRRRAGGDHANGHSGTSYSEMMADLELDDGLNPRGPGTPTADTDADDGGGSGGAGGGVSIATTGASMATADPDRRSGSDMLLQRRRAGLQ